MSGMTVRGEIMDCYYCKAKNECSAAVEPGSIVCTVNRLRYGGTHADDRPARQSGVFADFVGSV